MTARTTRQGRDGVIAHDLVEGIVYILIIQGWPNYAPDRDRTRDRRYAFDLSMWQAFLWLRYFYRQNGRDDDIQFYIRPHWMYGDSSEVRSVMAGMLGYAFRTWVFGDGSYDCTLDAERAEGMLGHNAIGRELLDELALRFRREYDFAADTREWPPDFEFEKEFGRDQA